MKLSEMLDQFEADLRLRMVSAATLYYYHRILTNLFRSLPLGTDDVTQITSQQIRNYVASLWDHRLADQTVAKQVEIIKSFFRHAVSEGYLQRDPAARLPKPRVGHRLPRMLSPNQVRALFDIIRQGQSQVDRRNLVVFHLCYTCGLRISEAASLRMANIDLEQGSLRVVGKGDKERRIYLKPATIQLLTEFLAEMGIQDYLFPGAGGGHITSNALRLKFRKYVKAAGLPPSASPHALRHSIAVHLLSGGAPISFVQQFLGHENLETTGIYTQLTDAMAKEIVARTPTAIDRSEKQPGNSKTLKEERSAYVVSALEWQILLEISTGRSLNKL